MKTLALALGLTFAVAHPVHAEETVVRSVDLPGASMEQEVTYHPTEAEYIAARDRRLERLRAGDQSAMVNPTDGPWMIVETTAKIGIAWKGVGAAQGRKHLRRVTAAEDALYRFEKEQQN